MKDIRLKEDDGDVYLDAGGALQWTQSTRQHQYDLLMSCQGHYRETPEVGVGSVNFINDNDPSYFMRAVRKSLTRDGMRVVHIGYEGDDLLIEAEYENGNR